MVRIVFICSLTAALLIILQGFIIGIYVTQYQEKEAIESSYQILSVAEEYFKDIYSKVKTYNAQMYQDKLVREQVRKYVSKGKNVVPSEKSEFRSLLNNHLKKQLGNDSGALIAADYYDLQNETVIPVFWKEETRGRKDYFAPALENAKKSLKIGAEKQRIYEMTVLGETTDTSTLIIYDFVRDPSDLSKVTGVLMFYYGIDLISDKLYAMGINDDMEVLLISQNGDLCYSTTHDWSKVSEELSVNSIKPGIYKDNKGLQVVCYNNRFSFCVVSRIDKAYLYDPVRRMNMVIILYTVMILILLVLILVGFERHFSVRMKKLAEGIQGIEAGSLDVVLQETSNHDEIDLMAHNLNEMQYRLKSQIEQEKENQEKNRRLQLLQKDAEFYALQAQIKPHFLYNTLEIIRMHAVSEHAPDTAVMIRLLADIFRENINRQSMTTIAEAVNYCEEYAELFSYRFDGELECVFHVDPSVKKYGIPTYVLQPILENALVHGLNKEREDPRVELCVELRDNDIIMSVEDNGSGMREEELEQLRERIGHYDDAVKSIGLANVNHRLHLLFGEAYGVEIFSRFGEGTKVMIKIPALTPVEWGKYVQSVDC